jgi:hypothetical protein
MLACHIKGVKNNFPFLIEVTKVETCDAEYDPGWNISNERIFCISLFMFLLHSDISLFHRVFETYVPKNNMACIFARSFTGNKWLMIGLYFEYCRKVFSSILGNTVSIPL